jgi:ribonuclease E
MPDTPGVKDITGDLPVEAGVAAEGGKKRKRRRKKKKGPAETAGADGQIDVVASSEQTALEPQDAQEPSPDELLSVSADDLAAKPKKRRRRRGRKGPKSADVGAVEGDDSADGLSVEAELPALDSLQQDMDAVAVVALEKPKRARSSRVKKKIESDPPVVEAPVVEPAVEAAPKAKKPRRSVAKKPVETVVETVEAAADAPRRAPRPRKKNSV